MSTVYERVDPFTREPLTTWIGIQVDERRHQDDVEQFAELRQELDALKVEGDPSGVLRSSLTRMVALSPILNEVTLPTRKEGPARPVFRALSRLR